jgi:hypothetical protein
LENARLQLLEYGNARAVVEKIWSLPLDVQTKVVITLWDWWTTRNKVNSGEARKATEEIYNLINKHCYEFKSEVKVPVVVPQQMICCSLPPSDHIKLNFDASFIPKTKDGAYGFVVRNDAGDFIAAGPGKLYHPCSALHDEAEACIVAMEATTTLGIHRVIFGSDSTTLVSAIKKGGHDLADTGVLMREARSLGLLHFDICEFSSCRESVMKY